MNRNRGLLAFLCTLLALGAVATHIPLVSGLESLGQLFAGSRPDALPPLERAFTPVTNPELLTGPGGLPSLGLFQLRRELRADALIRSLAQAQDLPPAVLKAFLAEASQGVIDEGGFYHAHLAEGDAQASDDASARTRAASELLGRYRRETGSLHGALVAWTAGPRRAARALARGDQDLQADLKALRRGLSAPLRTEAETVLCTVAGLALGLESRWPVQDPDASQRHGAGVRLRAGAGEALRAPMDGLVSYEGRDGPRGLCVELLHACDLRTELCGFERTGIQRGERVRVGQELGVAGQTPSLTLWIGLRAMDATLLLPHAS